MGSVLLPEHVVAEEVVLDNVAPHPHHTRVLLFAGRTATFVPSLYLTFLVLTFARSTAEKVRVPSEYPHTTWISGLPMSSLSFLSSIQSTCTSAAVASSSVRPCSTNSTNWLPATATAERKGGKDEEGDGGGVVNTRRRPEGARATSTWGHKWRNGRGYVARIIGTGAPAHPRTHGQAAAAAETRAARVAHLTAASRCWASISRLHAGFFQLR